MNAAEVYLVGIGMGGDGTLTRKAQEVINNSDLLIGADRMLEGFKKLNKPNLVAYLPREIGSYLRVHTEYQRVAILLSGDVGFYSGAKGILNELTEFDVKLVPGISSLIYFCAKLKMPWQDVYLTSVHGKDNLLIPHIKRESKTFSLLNGGSSLKELCEKLKYYGLGQVILHIGERLSYEDERIISCKAEELTDFNFDPLLVVLVENPNPDTEVFKQIEDEAFIRGEVPMTKSEVRTVSIAKLGLTKDAVVYDVGAGTGSVAIEMAQKSPDIRVYAIEKNEKGLELIKRNKQKFAADNLEIVGGIAPEALEELPAPTHVFIGGSAGNLKEILECIYRKNENAKVVLNTVSLNTLAEVMNLIEEGNYEATDIIQMNISKAKKLGKYQMMMGQNPIYIMVLNRVYKD